jgi:HEAT repeat protein
LVIASSGDNSKENILLDKIKTETNKGNLIWAGMGLLYLQCNHTTALFDFLVKNEDFGDAHMVPLFIKLNKDSLQQTAYNRINSSDVTTKILAAQILSVTPLNSKTEMLLKQAAKEWDINVKGYAIYSISQLQIGNLLETLKPLLDSSQTRGIALEALANSPTEADRNYLFDLINKSDTVSEELLNCFYQSKNIENLKYWLKLLYTKPTPKDYYFAVFKQPLIQSDTILSELQTALQKIKDTEILHELVRALEGRIDDKSMDIMIALLKNENKSVRYWTAKTLEHNSSARLKNQEEKRLLNKGLQDGN